MNTENLEFTVSDMQKIAESSNNQETSDLRFLVNSEQIIAKNIYIVKDKR